MNIKATSLYFNTEKECAYFDTGGEVVVRFSNGRNHAVKIKYPFGAAELVIALRHLADIIANDTPLHPCVAEIRKAEANRQSVPTEVMWDKE